MPLNFLESARAQEMGNNPRAQEMGNNPRALNIYGHLRACLSWGNIYSGNVGNAEGNALTGTIQHGDCVKEKRDWEYFTGKFCDVSLGGLLRCGGIRP